LSPRARAKIGVLNGLDMVCAAVMAALVGRGVVRDDVPRSPCARGRRPPICQPAGGALQFGSCLTLYDGTSTS
jgi:hypothetical protein